MSAAEADEIFEVLNRVKQWSPPIRIVLARRIVESLENSTDIDLPMHGVPVESVIGLLGIGQPPPNDQECRQIVEEER